MVLLSLSCVGSLPAEYVSAQQAATLAQHERDFHAAARWWQTAAASAPRADDHDEALFRAATAWRRAAEDQRAAALLRQLAARPGPRQARAHLDLARLELEGGGTQQGLRLLQDVVELFPSSGLAGPAMERALRHHLAHGPAQAHGYLLRTLRSVQEPALQELLLYRRARLFEAQKDRRQAMASYEHQLSQHPYPRGLYWEDAMLRLARLQRSAGRVREAAATLERMLEVRETAWLVGSYERRYSEARWLLAEILEQDARRPERAIHQYLLLANQHSHSALRDDAWWAAARLARRLGDEERACGYARHLQTEFPDSRFTRCTPLVCPTLTARGHCRDYIKRALKLNAPTDR